jgi:hypothetical protein
MVQEVFASILADLGKILNMKLAPDRNGSCMIQYTTGLKLVMESNALAERLMVIADLGTPAPGRYRENLFREALKANGLPPPRQGIFCYSAKKDSLILFESLPLGDLTGQKVADLLTPFLAKANLWRTAITKNEVPSFTGNELSFGATGTGSGMLGLR